MSLPSSINPWPVLPMKSYAVLYFSYILCSFSSTDVAFYSTWMPAALIFFWQKNLYTFLLCCYYFSILLLPTFVKTPIIPCCPQVKYHWFTTRLRIWTIRSICILSCCWSLISYFHLYTADLSRAAINVISDSKVEFAFAQVVWEANYINFFYL